MPPYSVVLLLLDRYRTRASYLGLFLLRAEDPLELLVSLILDLLSHQFRSEGAQIKTERLINRVPEANFRQLIRWSPLQYPKCISYLLSSSLYLLVDFLHLPVPLLFLY